jgi:lipopolysaccharide transport system ATP-binding protein
VGVGLAAMDPIIIQFNERDVIAFQVIDSLDGNSARGIWTGKWGGVMRPLLTWTTHFVPNENTKHSCPHPRHSTVFE